jgi:hypothetical protein
MIEYTKHSVYPASIRGGAKSNATRASPSRKLGQDNKCIKFPVHPEESGVLPSLKLVCFNSHSMPSGLCINANRGLFTAVARLYHML